MVHFGKSHRRCNTAKPKFGTARRTFVNAWPTQKSLTLDHRCFDRALIKRYAHFGGYNRFTSGHGLAGTESGVEAEIHCGDKLWLGVSMEVFCGTNSRFRLLPLLQRYSNAGPCPFSLRFNER